LRAKTRSCRTIAAPAAAAFLSRLDRLARVAPHVERREREVRRAADRHEQVVEVVGDAARERPDRLHLLRLAPLRLEPLRVRDVGDERHEAAVGARDVDDVHRPFADRGVHDGGVERAALAAAGARGALSHRGVRRVSEGLAHRSPLEARARHAEPGLVRRVHEDVALVRVQQGDEHGERVGHEA
jgi:hypothetical protein